MQLMKDELQLMIDDTKKAFEYSSEDAIGKIKALDHPTCSLLRILDKINYNNSRTPIRKSAMVKTQETNDEWNMKGVPRMTPTAKKGKMNTGLNLSEFIRDHLLGIDGFSMNKEGGFTYEEERALWREGKMTAAFLKQVAKMLQYPTWQVSNRDLLYTLKDNRNKILKLLKERPELDETIQIKSKHAIASSGMLRSPLLD
jgi:hypothetical protein